MVLIFNKIFLKLLFLFTLFMSVNLYAEDKKISKNIQELRNDGYSITNIVFHNDFWYLNLEKKPSFELGQSSGEITKKNKIEFISCKFNEIKTICYVP